MSFFIEVFVIVLEKKSISGIGGSNRTFMFNIIRNCQIISQSGYNILDFSQDCMRMPVGTHLN